MTTAGPRICVDKNPSTDQLRLSRDVAVLANPANGVNPALMLALRGDVPSVAVESAVWFTRKTWQPGATIAVAPIGPYDSRVYRRVAGWAKVWEQFARIKFRFLYSGRADIRVSFDPSLGSWSYVGTDCRIVPGDRATMNFGWLDADSDEPTYSSVVLHEFGHALGLGHEHQSPFGGVKWNLDTVYAWYERTQGWTRQQVDDQVIHVYDRSQVNGTAWDRDSIMEYPIDRSCVLDPTQAVGWNTMLSKQDVATIRALYPGAR